MTKPNWTFCKTPNCEHEAQYHGGFCKWCYDVNWRRRKTNKKPKVNTEIEANIISAVNETVGTIQARTIEKLIRDDEK
jgi:hypothetical protein